MIKKITLNYLNTEGKMLKDKKINYLFIFDFQNLSQNAMFYTILKYTLRKSKTVELRNIRFRKISQKLNGLSDSPRNTVIKNLQIL